MLGWVQETRPTEEPWLDSGATDPRDEDLENVPSWSENLGDHEHRYWHQRFDTVQRLAWLVEGNRFSPPPGFCQGRLGRESCSQLAKYCEQNLPSLQTDQRLRNIEHLRNCWTDPHLRIPDWLRIGQDHDGREWIQVLREADVDTKALGFLWTLKDLHGVFGKVEINRNIHRILKEHPDQGHRNISAYMGGCVRESLEALSNKEDWEPSVWQADGFEYAPRWTGSREFAWRKVIGASRPSPTEESSASRSGFSNRFAHRGTSAPFFSQLGASAV